MRGPGDAELDEAAELATALTLVAAHAAPALNTAFIQQYSHPGAGAAHLTLAALQVAVTMPAVVAVVTSANNMYNEKIIYCRYLRLFLLVQITY